MNPRAHGTSTACRSTPSTEISANSGRRPAYSGLPEDVTCEVTRMRLKGKVGAFPPMSLIESCTYHLEEARALALRLSAPTFSCAHAHCYGASVGQHLRHCVDHVESFLSGLATGRIDYDSRVRGGDCETDPQAAANRISATVHSLRRLVLNESASVLVKLDCGPGVDPWRTSTIGRELQFLVSHLVHHFAIIAIMCRSQGIEPSPEFGVAPSTLRHRASA